MLLFCKVLELVDVYTAIAQKAEKTAGKAPLPQGAGAVTRPCKLCGICAVELQHARFAIRTSSTG